MASGSCERRSVPWMGWKPDSFLLCKEPFRKGHHRHAPRILRLLYEEGYSIYFLELRGHGLSYRPVTNPSMVDIGDFDEYVEDLKSFLDTIVIPDQTENSELPDYTALPLFLYAHSMGGCIATLFLEKYPDIFQAAVLSSPMIKAAWLERPLRTWSGRL